jgi:hypothetical protein
MLTATTIFSAIIIIALAIAGWIVSNQLNFNQTAFW